MATRPVNKKPGMCKHRRAQRKQAKSKRASQGPMTEKIDFLLGVQEILPCLGNFYFTFLSECYDKFLLNCNGSPAKEAMIERLFGAMAELGVITSVVANSVADDGDDDDEDVDSQVSNRSSEERMTNADIEESQTTPDFSTKLLHCMGVAKKRAVPTKGQDERRRIRKLQEFHEVIRCMQETFRDTL